MTTRTSAPWTLLGVPSSAGGHTPGMDLAPAAIRAAGLADRLRERGHTVSDAGDVPGFRRRPDPDHLDRQNIAEAARVAGDVAEAVANLLATGALPLVIGGDCTITVGVVAGFRRAGLPAALLYVDGGPDLHTPGTVDYGNMDAMGVAHMLALPESDPVLAGVGGAPPLLRSAEVVSFGDALPDEGDDLERGRLSDLGIPRFSAARIHDDPEAAARSALAAIESAGDRFVVHFDVDVLGHAHLPLANMPNPDAPPWGLAIPEVEVALRTFAASDRFAGIVLTEVNPGNAPDASTLRAYVDLVVAGIG
ncbi:arginase family protein [Leifsonia sp. F6_8S_P_1B]|uniref:Arginase family protein n=1 Tax=Leifsonia williamsii TaxID=3035919 RepID=A0ABT8KD92_9MICO|nr:arginase family protein [Leifsonia williamsii]MDN4614938.1 arginase family protein [Leifsonia williamsii]